MTSKGLPAKPDNKIKRKKTASAEDPPPPMAMTAAGAETKPSREPLAAEAATCRGFQKVLESRFGKVKDLIGPWKAYIIMGTALHMLERMQKAGQKTTRAWVPGAFLSVAAAVSGVPDADDIRYSFRKRLRGKATDMEFRESEALLVTALPFQRDLAEAAAEAT